jgi:predicted TIM-barrel fold metal-dependent hydrolase
MPPSEYWKRQVYATFMDDAIGIELCHHVGENTYMWASDYPHTQSTWPHSRAVIAENFATVSADIRHNITCHNVADLYGFDVQELMQLPVSTEASTT